MLSLAKHEPAHLYFTGRNVAAAESLIQELNATHPSVSLTFLDMDLSSLSSVRSSAAKFTHDRLDILILNAGILDRPPALSVDGFEIHMAVNHLGHAMLVRELLPVLLRTAENPMSDVRVVFISSKGHTLHPKQGILWDMIRTKQDSITVSYSRYA